MAARESNNRVDQVLRALAAAVVLVGALEFASALVLRLAVPPRIRANVEALGGRGPYPSRYLPDARWHHGLNPDHPDYAGRLNTHGTLGPEFSVPKPAGEQRVLLVGDSTVEGTGLPPADSLPSQLRRLLPAATVINAGVGHHNSRFTLAYLRGRLLDFEPDVVVIRSSYNDWLPYCVPGLTADYGHVFPRPYAVPDIDTYWRRARWSPTLQLMGLALRPNQARRPFGAFPVPDTGGPGRAADFAANAGRFQVYGANLQAMIRACREAGAAVLLLDLEVSPEPAAYGPDAPFGPGIVELVGRLDAEAARVAAAAGVRRVDDGPARAADFRDWCHRTASGNRRTAEALAAPLRELLAAGREPRDGP